MTAVALARRRLPFTEAVRSRTLGNGARFFVVENHFNPTVALGGSLAAGRLYAPADRRLIASLTAGELMKGTSRRTKLELAEDLESRAASLSFSSDASDPVGVDVSGGALSRDADLLLDTLAEVLTTPAFPEDELEKERKRLVGSIRQQQDQPSVRAYEEALRRIYPPSHPLHRLTCDERIARVEALRRDDLAAFYGERDGASSLVVVVVGDVGPDRILDRLERSFYSWTPGPVPQIPLPAAPPPSPATETVRMPDKASADVVPGDARGPEAHGPGLSRRVAGQLGSGAVLPDVAPGRARARHRRPDLRDPLELFLDPHRRPFPRQPDGQARKPRRGPRLDARRDPAGSSRGE